MNKFMTESGRIYHEIVILLSKVKDSVVFLYLVDLLEDSLILRFPDNLLFKYAFMECALRNGLTLDEALKVRELGRKLKDMKEVQ